MELSEQSREPVANQIDTSEGLYLSCVCVLTLLLFQLLQTFYVSFLRWPFTTFCMSEEFIRHCCLKEQESTILLFRLCSVCMGVCTYISSAYVTPVYVVWFAYVWCVRACVCMCGVCAYVCVCMCACVHV